MPTSLWPRWPTQHQKTPWSGPSTENPGYPFLHHEFLGYLIYASEIGLGIVSYASIVVYNGADGPSVSGMCASELVFDKAPLLHSSLHRTEVGSSIIPPCVCARVR